MKILNFLNSGMLLAATLAFAPGCAVEEDDVATATEASSSSTPTWCRKRFPDLIVKALSDFRLERVNGNVFLRFSTNVGNVGAGPYEVHMLKEVDPGYVLTAQRVYCTEGDVFGWIDYALTNHADPTVASNPEIRIDHMLRLSLRKDGAEVLEDTSDGCLSDAVSLSAWGNFQGAPGSPTYTSCRLYDGPWAQGDDAPTMGISAGWASFDDWHKWEPFVSPEPRAYQSLNITNVPDGIYTLRVEIFNPGGLYDADTSNQVKDVQVAIYKNSLSVTAEQPPACDFCL